MSKTPVELWCEALRGGEYKRCAGALRRDENRFCCLGVACDVYQKNVGGLEITGPEFGAHYYDNQAQVLPDRVRTWLGLHSDSGSFDTDIPRRHELGFTTLAGANDAGKSFEEIAAIIESRPPGLFVEAKASPA